MKIRFKTLFLGLVLAMVIAVLGAIFAAMNQHVLSQVHMQVDLIERFLQLYGNTMYSDLQTGNFKAVERKMMYLSAKPEFQYLRLDTAAHDFSVGNSSLTEDLVGFDGFLIEHFVNKSRLEIRLRDEVNSEWATLTVELSKSLLVSPLREMFYHFGRVVLAALLLFAGMVILLVDWHAKELGRLEEFVTEVSDASLHGKDSAALIPKQRFLVSEWHALAFHFQNTLTRYFDLKNKLLEQEYDAKIGQIATKVAHDIRTPLAAIQFLAGSNNFEQSEQANILSAASGRLKEIADDLLNCFKSNPLTKNISKKKESIKKEDVTSLITEVKLSKNVGDGVEIKLEFEEVCAQMQLHVELSTLKRTLANLLTNAIEALDKKNGIILIRFFCIYSREFNKRQLGISIGDNGKGMSDELRMRVAIEGGSYGKASGTGIGLMNARALVEEFGSDFKIVSTLKKGTQVSMAFDSV